jgi:predicted PurR-regulated permease PerM
MRGFRTRVHRRPTNGQPHDSELFIEVESAELSRMFAAPGWLRDLGGSAWALVGITVLLIGAIWLLSLLNTIVAPVLTATIVAAVVSPIVRRLQHRVPRAAAAAIVFLAIIVLAGALVVLILGGVTSQAQGLQGSLQDAAGKIQGWLQDLGVDADKAQGANQDASASLSSAFHALLNGLGTGVKTLASLAVFLSFTALSLFFLLKDGPVIREWGERHMGIPPSVARIVTGRTLQSLRGYFAGVTAVAAFNAIVIGLGALVLGVDHVGSIAIINFVAAYVPYLGAWSAGAFTVLVALSTAGTSAAIAMIVIVLLANGALQQMIQPIAFGATLGIHPLAVLVVTISGGALFGTIGLVLAAPLTAAALHISADVAKVRARDAEAAAQAMARASGSTATAAG